MKKKVLLSLLVIIGLFSIIGCRNNKKDKYDILKGTWKATPENQYVVQIDSDGNTFGGKEDYLLKCDGNGNYSLSIQEKEMAKGSYTISNNDITFKDDANMMISLCKLIDDNELDCSKKSQYAFKYIKINND